MRAKLEKEDKKFKFSSFIDSLRISFGRNPSDVNRYSWRDIIVKDAAKSDKRVKELMDAVILIEESIKRSEKLIESEIELDKILLTIYKLNLLVLENIDKTPRWYQIVIVSPNGILTHQAKVLALTQYSLIFLATLTFTGGAIGSLQNLPIIAGIYALLTNPDFIKALTSADYSKMTNSAVFTKLKQLYKDYIDFLGSNSK